MGVRVRFAPSPTGDMHLGGVRSAVFNWLFARATEGTFILRIEDTDRNRLVPGSIERVLEVLHWLKMDPDEGPYLDDQGNIQQRGEHGPYIQSQRLPIYQHHAQILIDTGKAYRCFCSTETLEQMRAEQAARHEPPRYDRRCRNLSKEESDRRADAGEPFVVRQAIPLEGEVKVLDVVRGTISFQAQELDDHVLLKTDGFPTYQLANVVDDHLMEITHVLRGEEWIPSAPKNILLYEAFGWTPPEYVHMPLIIGPDRAKLSKRHGAMPVMSYKEKGYLPDALLNMVAFLGWSPGTEEEFFTREELVQKFTIDRVQKAPALFSPERLDYVNGWYVRRMTVGEVAEHMLPYLKQADIEPQNAEYLLKVASVLQERIKHFDEVPELTWFFFRRPVADDELLSLMVPRKAQASEIFPIVLEAIDFLQNIPESEWTVALLEDKLREFVGQHGYKGGNVFWPLRAALTGEPASPGVFEMLAVLGKEESLARLRAVV